MTTSAREHSVLLADLLRRERHALAEFLVALADFDLRERWLELGHASLFSYLHRHLGLSKGAAFYRMTAARLVRQHPEVVAPLRDGRLCLTSVVELSKVLTAGNRDEILPRFFHLSKREARAVTAEFRPEAAVPRREVVTAVRPASAALLLAPPVHPANRSVDPGQTFRPADLGADPGPSVHPATHGAEQGASAHLAGHGADSEGSVHPANHGSDPEGSVHPANHGSDPEGSVHPANHGADPGPSVHPANHGADPGPSVHPANHASGAAVALPSPPGLPPMTVEPKTAELSRLHITVPHRLLWKLEAARAALSHSHPGAGAGEVLEVGLDLIIERHARRRGLVERPRKPRHAPSAPRRARQEREDVARGKATDVVQGKATDVPGGGRRKKARDERDRRHIPAHVKRAVWKRDDGRCQWPLDGGGVCGSTHRLELDHVVPLARGGPSTPENLRLLCDFHNQIAARRTFGDACLDRHVARRRAGRSDPGSSP